MSTTETLSVPSVQPKWMTIVGWILTIAPAGMLLMSAAMKFNMPKEYLGEFVASGWPAKVVVPLGIAELTSTVLYLIPQTAVLGAVLLTGYMGGALSHHVRLEEPFYTQAGIGVVIWLALFFRDPRIRALLPIRW